MHAVTCVLQSDDNLGYWLWPSTLFEASISLDFPPLFILSLVAQELTERCSYLCLTSPHGVTKIIDLPFMGIWTKVSFVCVKHSAHWATPPHPHHPWLKHFTFLWKTLPLTHPPLQRQMPSEEYIIGPRGWFHLMSMRDKTDRGFLGHVLESLRRHLTWNCSVRKKKNASV